MKKADHMIKKEKGLMAFAERLNESLDAIGFTARGEGRQTALGNFMGLTQKAARKWLVGEGYPGEDSRNKLAELCRVRYEWLMTGNGERYPSGMSVRHVPVSATVPDGEKTIRIPLMNVNGAQGAGCYPPEHEIVIQEIMVGEQWLRRNLIFSAPVNLSIITGIGDSMKPAFQDGDLLLVDRGVSEIKVDAVYVIYLHGKIYVKRLQSRPDGALLMISDNKAYEPFIILQHDRVEMEVRGRVLAAWNMNKL
ncbi:helix-turn-helix transcriptional regulator [Acidithiobacillus thiooxidans]|uniref:S24 family peptidase n=1 Tax=Acidithiobacillus thiooxidans TaxID=930 RepID=UPI001C07E9E8|nr:helix-turn-helix transcriptional regulator [Acidithiobacillus thiooxidans]MBU2750815.1 helix-turn-helix transcriptional regulator [Acidithiobacillus thiooxidans]